MKKISKYLIELIVIVVGITLSFMVDEWREERQNREETLKVLSNLKFNLQTDIDGLEFAEKSLTKYIAYSNNIIANEIDYSNYDTCFNFMFRMLQDVTMFGEAGNIGLNKEAFVSYISKLPNPILYVKETEILMMKYYNDKMFDYWLKRYLNLCENNLDHITLELPNFSEHFRNGGNKNADMHILLQDYLKSDRFKTIATKKKLTESELRRIVRDKIESANDLMVVIEEELQN